jgi:hypothetical protein
MSSLLISIQDLLLPCGEIHYTTTAVLKAGEERQSSFYARGMQREEIKKGVPEGTPASSVGRIRFP